MVAHLVSLVHFFTRPFSIVRPFSKCFHSPSNIHPHIFVTHPHVFSRFLLFICLPTLFKRKPHFCSVPFLLFLWLCWVFNFCLFFVCYLPWLTLIYPQAPACRTIPRTILVPGIVGQVWSFSLHSPWTPPSWRKPRPKHCQFLRQWTWIK